MNEIREGAFALFLLFRRRIERKSHFMIRILIQSRPSPSHEFRVTVIVNVVRSLHVPVKLNPTLIGIGSIAAPFTRTASPGHVS